jgi:hypothetical protein
MASAGEMQALVGQEQIRLLHISRALSAEGSTTPSQIIRSSTLRFPVTYTDVKFSIGSRLFRHGPGRHGAKATAFCFTLFGGRGCGKSEISCIA